MHGKSVIMLNHCRGNCWTRKQTRMTYRALFAAFGNILDTGGEIALKYYWHAI